MGSTTELPWQHTYLHTDCISLQICVQSQPKKTWLLELLQTRSSASSSRENKFALAVLLRFWPFSPRALSRWTLILPSAAWMLSMLKLHVFWLTSCLTELSVWWKAPGFSKESAVPPNDVLNHPISVCLILFIIMRHVKGQDAWVWF